MFKSQLGYLISQPIIILSESSFYNILTSFLNWFKVYPEIGLQHNYHYHFPVHNKKSKLRVYRELKEDFECKKYLHGVSDIGSKLLFRFRSGTHGLNEELGRHSSRNSIKACVFCECECESVEHV